MKQNKDISNIKNITEQFNDNTYDTFIVVFGLNGKLNGYGESVIFFDYQKTIKYIEENSKNWDYCYLKAIKKIKLWDND